MNMRLFSSMGIVCSLLLIALGASVRACCTAGPPGVPVVNADQTVIIVWDSATQMQHFIRQASFTSQADDFGFLIPSPTQPELAESGNDAFPLLKELTAPAIKYVQVSRVSSPPGAKDVEMKEPKPDFVKVLERKLVAGFNATVLETNSTVALAGWLKENGFAFSAAVEAWAKPYVDAKWKITALKVAKDPDSRFSTVVKTGSLRMSFKTDRPLFPYREAESKSAADQLGTHRRLLRIYFVADARYDGELTKEQPWTGKVAWSGKVNPEHRRMMLDHLKLPAETGPAEWWLTEFEDAWPYRLAQADVYFARAAKQDDVRREPITVYQYVDAPSSPRAVQPQEPPVVEKTAAPEEPRGSTFVWIVQGVLGVALFLAIVFGTIWIRQRG